MVDSKTYTYASQFTQTGVKCATVHYKSSIAAASATVPDNLTFGDTADTDATQHLSFDFA